MTNPFTELTSIFCFTTKICTKSRPNSTASSPKCALAKTTSFLLPDHPVGPLSDVLKIGVTGANVKILSLHRLKARLGSRGSIRSPGRDGSSSPGGAAIRARGSGRCRAAARFRHRFRPQISRLCTIVGGGGLIFAFGSLTGLSNSKHCRYTFRFPDNRRGVGQGPLW